MVAVCITRYVVSASWCVDVASGSFVPYEVRGLIMMFTWDRSEAKTNKSKRNIDPMEDQHSTHTSSSDSGWDLSLNE